MKNYLKSALVAVLFAGVFASCDDNDTTLPPTASPIFSEDFSRPPGEMFDFEGWTVFTEAGTKDWFKNAFGGNDYIEFSSFNSGNASNIGWAITPAINIDAAQLKRLIFQSAQHHATSLDNKFEVLVSGNYDGENVLAAEWELKSFRLPPYANAYNYDFYNSGVVDLSNYSGEIHIAFRVKGNSTTQTGGFQVDNIKVF